MEPIPSDPARLTVDSRCAHGEGVLWCERRQALLWVDIDAHHGVALLGQVTRRASGSAARVENP